MDFLYLFDFIDIFNLKKQATEVACKVLAWLMFTGKAR